MPIRDLSPEEIASAHARGDVLIVDVREPHELAIARIAGAVNLPLSSFDPDAIPDPGGRQVVFMCAGGVRSAKALAIAQSCGKPYDSHLAGGIKAWAMAGYDFERG